MGHQCSVVIQQQNCEKQKTESFIITVLTRCFFMYVLVCCINCKHFCLMFMFVIQIVNEMFVCFELKKICELPAQDCMPSIELKPCVYKKR